MHRNKKLRIIFFSLAFALASLPGVVGAGDDGCVSCHAGDLGLNVLLQKVEAHPDVGPMVNTVPTDCLMCHAKGAPAALSAIVHKAHFAADPGMSCTACHAMNVETGEATQKSGAKNW